mgnify:FL=1
MNDIETSYISDKFDKLCKLYEDNNICNIIFYGDNKSGKKTLLEKFILKIYTNRENINKYVMILNCSHGKGNIKFIRDNLKYFANTIIDQKNNIYFKSIILLNADKLTFDAQSALRRCIEIYNHSTRFFIVVDDKYKILRPILSRFSEIYIRNITSHECKDEYHILYNKKYNKLVKYFCKYDKLIDIKDTFCYKNILKFANVLYLDGYSGNILLHYIENCLEHNFNKYKFILVYNKYKKEFRSEELLIFVVLIFYYFRINILIENILII